MPNLSVIIPVYNEGDNITVMLGSLKSNIPHDTQVLLVYDFDEDNTLPVVEHIRNDLPFKVTLHKNAIGPGVLNAIKAGIKAALGNYVFVMMADLSDPPELVPLMLDKAINEKLDLVCASRFMPGGSHTGGPWLKGLLSKMAGLSLWYFTGLPTHDATNNFKLYSKRFLQNTEIESKGGFEIALELTVKAWKNGWRIGELPSSWKERSGGKSNFKLWKWLPHYLKWYLYAMFSHGKSNDNSSKN